MSSDKYLDHAKANKDKFIANLVKGKALAPSKTAIFMAGSTGAGKTEVATGLAENYPDYVVIDADNFRAQFPEYNGTNSSDFQKAASWLVEQAFRYVIEQGYSFILDATFALESASKNIKRAVNKQFDSIEIFYVYQDPMIAWEFTKAREKKEGRVVPKATFINAFFKSRENIIYTKEKFPEITINLVLKDYQNTTFQVLPDVDSIDLVLPERWTREELEEKLDD